jgi:hypothetical protein
MTDTIPPCLDCYRFKPDVGCTEGIQRTRTDVVTKEILERRPMLATDPACCEFAEAWPDTNGDGGFRAMVAAFTNLAHATGARKKHETH